MQHGMIFYWVCVYVSAGEEDKKTYTALLKFQKGEPILH